MVRAGLAVLLVVPAAVAQAPPAAAPAQAQPQVERRQMDQELWAHLLGWQKVMQGANNFVSKGGTKTETDTTRTPPASKTHETDIWCLKPNLARMRLDRVPPPGQKKDPNEFETYICDGRSVFEYNGERRVVTEYPLGANGGVGDNLLLEFMSGSITAEQAAQRFTIDWIKRDDSTYLILELRPLLARDKQEFDVMTLVLIKPGLAAPLNRLAYLPRLAKIVKQNGQMIESWDFPGPMLNATKTDGKLIAPQDFQFVAPPKDWKREKAAGRPAQPRVARPGAP